MPNNEANGRNTIFHLRRIHVEGYKALDPVDLRLPGKLLFLIGSNGAGKSSTLQALAFIQHFALGRPIEFFEERSWNRVDVRSHTAERPHNTLRYNLIFESDEHERVLWQFIWGLHSEQTLNESMWVLRPKTDAKLLYRFDRKGGLRTDADQEYPGLIAPGSILAVLEAKFVTSEFALAQEIINWCAGITSLELLSPLAMRSNARGSPHGIGTRGQRLAGFIATLDTRKKARIVERLRAFYPLANLTTTRKKAGWIDLRIAESFDFGNITAQHISDGFLRMLALCAIPEFGTRSTMVLLDEIEDGIEPHILPRLIERVIKDSEAQFVATSHSPLLVNFFDSEDVVLVTREDNGRSNFTRLQDLPIIQQGREYMGSGEIWANSGIETLNNEVKENRTRQTVERSGFRNMFSEVGAEAFLRSE